MDGERATPSDGRIVAAEWLAGLRDDRARANILSSSEISRWSGAEREPVRASQLVDTKFAARGDMTRDTGGRVIGVRFGGSVGKRKR